MTLRLVAATVALQGWFPALRLGGAGEKRQIRRAPIPFHEELQVMMVPGIGLGLQERSNCRVSARCGSAVSLRLPKNNCRQQQDHPAYRTQLHHLHLRSQQCSRVLVFGLRISAAGLHERSRFIPRKLTTRTGRDTSWDGEGTYAG